MYNVFCKVHMYMYMYMHMHMYNAYSMSRSDLLCCLWLIGNASLLWWPNDVAGELVADWMMGICVWVGRTKGGGGGGGGRGEGGRRFRCGAG